MFFQTFRKTALLACLSVTGVAFGQRFDFGLKAGVATLEPTRSDSDESKRYITGVSAEYRIYRGFAVEGDFLYRHDGSSSAFTFNSAVLSGDNTATTNRYRTRVNIFEAPVLGKYYFRSDSKLQPFVLTGYSFRKGRADVDISSTSVTSAGATLQKSSYSYWSPLDIGVNAGAGILWRFQRVALAPEIRYTHWGGSVNSNLSRNQADVLLGIRF